MTTSVVAATESGVTAIAVWTLILVVIAALGAALAALSVRRVGAKEEVMSRELAALHTAVDRQVRQSSDNDSWNRDQVTARYQELLFALSNVDRVVAEEISAAVVSTPVGDLKAATQALDKAYDQLNLALTAALVVARRRVHPLALELSTGIDRRVFAPLAPETGIPAPAHERLQSEHAYITRMHSLLLKAMRADLGLLDPSAEATLIFTTKEVESGVQADRSTAAGRSAVQLIDLLEDFGVMPLLGAEDDFVMSDALVVQCEELYSAVSPSFQAVLRHIGDEIHLAIRPDLTDDRLEEIYEIAVRLVEAGLRGNIHRRDGLDGSSLFLIDPTHKAGMDRV
ncbi:MULTISPECIES: hypothetical protein [unclassified Rhodococcus (in: high G+C Gram-positive bacteria)]|uniref:hypothetical protein n=1 Tax=unclassified Rhodococcus (in: high G+C Gram-positive bacteria) TaxID=192944 RepID=UPI000B9AA949|nr:MULTISPECIES: hypothetical protein [unclassified Rhodococcus (in: high G+C Gram-positive bacteria)]OZE34103.1 hypothetical protein CH259_18925 [Rhodococcus sp. 05-2254-4]OZE51301.1 hypothetical protein CH261_01610 [Rhodococcus sp. 05-2254-3]OZE52952.1 hypothetical protein CH283_06700 [Rhodococcus sp. 05-2254-2]